MTMLIIVCSLILAERPLVYGQNFAPPSPTQESTTDIVDGSLSTTEFKALEQSSAVTLLNNKTVTNFFAKHFTINGEYGELENGAIVEDWSSIQSAMNREQLTDVETKNLLSQLNADQIQAAYASWIRQQRSLRDQLTISNEQSTANDSAKKNLITLIQNSFDWSSNTNGKLKNGTILRNTVDWEQWARQQGLPAAGLALMALYGTVRRRRELDEKNYDNWSNEFSSATKGTNLTDRSAYNRVYQNLSRNIYQNRSQEVAHAQASVAHLKPGAKPIKSSTYNQYEQLVNQARKFGRGSTQGVYSSARRLRYGRRYNHFMQAGRKFYHQALALEHQYAGQTIPSAIARKITDLKTTSRNFVNNALQSYRWYGMRHTDKQRMFQRNQQTMIQNWTKQFAPIKAGLSDEIKRHKTYDTKQAAYNLALQTAQTRVQNKYRTWSTYFRQFWNDQREKSSLVLRENIQIKSIVKKVQAAFATRQIKSKQELETKTLDFYTSFNHAEQKQLLNDASGSKLFFSFDSAQKKITTLSQVVSNLQTRQKNLNQELHQKLAQLSENKKRSRHYLSRRTLHECYYSYRQNRRRFRGWNRWKQQQYERNFNQRRTQAQRAYFTQKSQIERHYASQVSQLRHRYKSILPSQMIQQVAKAQKELDQA